MPLLTNGKHLVKIRESTKRVLIINVFNATLFISNNSHREFEKKFLNFIIYLLLKRIQITVRYT